MARPDSDYDDDELSPRERQRIRRLIDEDNQADAIKAAIKTWIITLGAIAGAVAAVKVLIIDAVGWFGRIPK